MRKIMSKSKIEKRARLHRKIRSKVSGTAEIPRLAIFRSNKFIYAQLIDDITSKTLASSSDLKTYINGKENKVESAKLVGKSLAENAIKSKIKKVVFDRGGFNYHGRVKALADGAREGGLMF